MTKTSGDGSQRPSKADLYLPLWAVEEVLRARAPRPASSDPLWGAAGGGAEQRRSGHAAEPLAGGCLLYRLPSTTLALWKRVEKFDGGSAGNGKESLAERTAWR
jgi:hypothetical protein